MDFKTRILSWENAVGENPAILVLGIILLITVVFIAAVFLDGYLSKRKNKKRRR